MCLRVFQGQGHKDPRTYEHKERVIDVCWDNFFSLIRTGEQAHLVRKQGRREIGIEQKHKLVFVSFGIEQVKQEHKLVFVFASRDCTRHISIAIALDARRAHGRRPHPTHSHATRRHGERILVQAGAASICCQSSACRRCLHLLPSSACMCKLTTTHCHDRMTVLIRPHVRPHVSAVKRLRTARASAAKQTRGLRIPKSCALDTAA